MLAKSQGLSSDDFAISRQITMLIHHRQLEPNSASVTSVRRRRNATDISLTLSRFTTGQFQEISITLRALHAPHRCTEQPYL